MKVHRPPNPRSPEYDDEYEFPYLNHGNIGWTDHLEPRKRPYKVEKPFPFGFGVHAASTPSKRVSVKDRRKSR